jgi:putative endonuclease
MDPRHALGSESEKLAARELVRRGYAIVARNEILESGELDIVARRGAEVVIVEVRSRTDDPEDEAAESVRPPKRSRVRKAAEEFLAGRPVDYEEVRIFVASVRWRSGRPRLHIYEDAF